MTQYDERYVTLAEVKREIPFSAADFDNLSESEFDALLEGDADTDGLMERASQRVEEWSGTQWFQSTVTVETERPEWSDKKDLPLANTPVDSVSEILIDGEAFTDYHVEDTHVRLTDETKRGSWPTGFKDIQITYTHGFATVPETVTGAVIRLVRNAIDQIQSDGVINESIGGASFTYRAPKKVRAEVTRELPDAPTYLKGAQLI